MSYLTGREEPFVTADVRDRAIAWELTFTGVTLEYFMITLLLFIVPVYSTFL